jgi:uncharacterized membrane protein
LSGARAAVTAAWWAAAGSLVGLIFLCVAWELFLAPVRPGGSWLVLKVLPLMAALFGVLRARRYTFKWTTLAIWFYVAEGATRAWTDGGLSARLAAIELALAFAYFGAAVAWLRATRSGAGQTD